MANGYAEADFKQGVDLLQSGNPEGAIGYFRSAVEGEKRNPYYLSFLGLAIARSEKKWTTASQLCETALRLNPGEPQFYLNLAEVYAAANRSKEATELLESAVKRFRRSAPVKRNPGAIGKQGQVLPFPAGAHFLNRTLEQLRDRATNSPHEPEKA